MPPFPSANGVAVVGWHSDKPTRKPVRQWHSRAATPSKALPINTPAPTTVRAHRTIPRFLLFTLPSSRIMPSFSRPIGLGAIDRFDNGSGFFSLPLEYHELFRIGHDLQRLLAPATFIDETGAELQQADSFVVQTLSRLSVDLLLRISAASYGGSLPLDRPEWELIRPNAFSELGLIAPPLLDFFRQHHGQLPFEGPLSTRDLHIWIDIFAEVLSDTRDWISIAQRRARILSV
ncbi:hypothetical protein C2E23DRAFT_894094, partial [Lenzites betulinus]